MYVIELRLNDPPQLRLDNREIIAARLASRGDPAGEARAAGNLPAE